VKEEVVTKMKMPPSFDSVSAPEEPAELDRVLGLLGGLRARERALVNVLVQLGFVLRQQPWWEARREGGREGGRVPRFVVLPSEQVRRIKFYQEVEEEREEERERRAERRRREEEERRARETEEERRGREGRYGWVKVDEDLEVLNFGEEEGEGGGEGGGGGGGEGGGGGGEGGGGEGEGEGGGGGGR